MYYCAHCDDVILLCNTRCYNNTSQVQQQPDEENNMKFPTLEEEKYNASTMAFVRSYILCVGSLRVHAYTVYAQRYYYFAWKTFGHAKTTGFVKSPRTIIILTQYENEKKCVLSFVRANGNDVLKYSILLLQKAFPNGREIENSRREIAIARKTHLCARPYVKHIVR